MSGKQISKFLPLFRVARPAFRKLLGIMHTLLAWLGESFPQSKKKRYKLGILAILKNESLVLEEWIRHYARQGIEIYYLIDNNSTDRSNEIIFTLSSEFPIVYRFDARNYPQIDAYNELLSLIKKDCEWIIVCDLDEFIYSRNEYPRILDSLISIDKSVSSILIPWKQFGSCGLIEQPSSVVRSFTKRRNYIFLDSTPLMIQCKYIARTSRISHLGVHFCKCYYGNSILPDGSKAINDSPFQPITEVSLKYSFLHLNHYQIQSWSFFQSVKMTRGDAATSDHLDMRTAEYFKILDYNEIDDLELSLAD